MCWWSAHSEVQPESQFCWSAVGTPKVKRTFSGVLFISAFLCQRFYIREGCHCHVLLNSSRFMPGDRVSNTQQLKAVSRQWIQRSSFSDIRKRSDIGAVCHMQNCDIQADDLLFLSELGRGAYGVVEKVRHTQSGTIMAVKVSKIGSQITDWLLQSAMSYVCDRLGQLCRTMELKKTILQKHHEVGMSPLGKSK